MTLENMMATVLDRIIAGERVNEEIEGWNISNLNGPLIVDMVQNSCAFYGFSIQVFKNLIKFYNYHREASKGTGTLSLRELEKIFGTLSNKRRQSIMVFFDPFGQQDTEKWLQKNGYTINEDGIYQKLFKYLIKEF